MLRGLDSWMLSHFIVYLVVGELLEALASVVWDCF